MAFRVLESVDEFFEVGSRYLITATDDGVIDVDVFEDGNDWDVWSGTLPVYPLSDGSVRWEICNDADLSSVVPLNRAQRRAKLSGRGKR